MSQSSSDQPNEQSATATLLESDQHRLLASERRRILLDVLGERSTPIDVEDVAMAVAMRLEDADDEQVDAGTVERVTIALHHVHLPTLSEAGIVDYDPSSHTVESFRDVGL